MAQEPKLYDLKTSVTIQGDKAHASRVQLDACIDSFKSLNLTHYTGSDASSKAIKARNSKVFEAMGKRQNTYFSDRGSPDVSASCKVKGSTVFKLKGYLTNSHYAFSSGSVAQSDQVLDQWSRIDAFDPSIYCSKPLSNTKDESKSCGFQFGGEKAMPDRVNWYLPKTIKLVLEDMVAKGPECWEGIVTEKHEVEMRNHQHSLNKKLLPDVVKMWENSMETFYWHKLFPEFLGQESDLSHMLMRTIMNRLSHASGSWLSTVLGICEDFCCYLAPGELGSSGNNYQIYHYKYAMQPEKMGKLKLPIIYLDARTGAYEGAFQIGYVVSVLKGAQVNTKAEGNRNNLKWNGWPEDGPSRIKGTAMAIEKIPAPPWYDPTVVLIEDLNDEGENDKEEGNPLSKRGKAVQEQKRMQQDFKNSTVMREWARVHYERMALNTSVVEIGTPLIPETAEDIEVGKRYKVRDYDGTDLFEGFLSSASALASSNGQRTAQLTLVFTHVEFLNFTLPHGKR